ncbi:nuclease-related domain-containing protein [Mesobacillus boroniphilus]|uniref:nuclease-related domain-containing protein n=1 Tax=Mesobacillus boroniphilus TaxID=308892 RepID=UPI001BCD85A9
MKILIYEAVVKRLPFNHPRKKEFQTKLMKLKAGYKGEVDLDYYLAQLPEKEFILLQGLRLPHFETHFQIDTLLLSPSFFINFESKNYAGEIDIDLTFDQLIRTIDGKQDTYGNPILQAKIQTSNLTTWLKNNSFSYPPIEYFVTISSAQTIIKNSNNSPEVFYRVFRTARALYKIEDMKLKFKSETLTMKDLKKIAHKLIKSHQPLIVDPKVLNLPLNELIKGIQCPECHQFGMKRIHGNWICSSCSHLSKTAHISAIKDFFLLHGFSIDNQQLREFLGIDSVDLATHILKSINPIPSGSKKNRIYSPPKDFFS